jgi:hypothetical protein
VASNSSLHCKLSGNTRHASQRLNGAKTSTGGWVSGSKEIFINSANNRPCLGSYGLGDICSTGTITADGLWHHVAVTFTDSSNAVNFFLDGQPSGGGTLALRPDVAGHVIKLGANPPHYFHGQLDEFRINRNN